MLFRWSQYPTRIALALACAAALLVFLNNAPPILVCANIEPGLVRPRKHCLLNPLRDQSAEVAAAALFHRMRTGDLATLLPLPPSEYAKLVIERERKWPILQWRLARYIVSDDQIGLMFWVQRGGGYATGEPLEEEVSLIFRKQNGTLSLIDFSAIY